MVSWHVSPVCHLVLCTDSMMDLPHQAKQLVCQYLNLQDLRSARLASKEWCRAASAAVSTVAVGIPHTPWAPAKTLAAYPCAVRIICHSNDFSSSGSAEPRSSLQQRAESRSWQQPTAKWSEQAFAMLVADSGPQADAAGRQQLDKWSVVLKSSPTAQPRRDEACPDAACWRWSALHYCRVTHLLLHKDARLSSQQVEECGRRFPAATCLHAGLGHPIQPGNRGGLLGVGVFHGLQELLLHSTAAAPLRLRDADLQLPALQHLQLTGNLTLSFGGGLQSSQLTSLTLQQALSQIEAQQLLDRQPRLEELAVLAVESESAPPMQVLKWASSVRAVQSLQGLVEWMVDDPAVDQQLLFGPGALGLADARSALDYVLTPPWVRTAESIAEAMLPSETGIAARTRASPAVATAANATQQHPANPSAHTPGQASGPPVVLEAAGQHPAAPAEPAAAVQSGVQVEQHHLRQLRVGCGCWVDLQPLLQLCCPEQLTLSTLPAITDALHRGGWLGRYVSHVSIAYLAGAIPAPLHMQLPMGTSLRELQLDTSRTGAGIEVDDRALLAITSSCRQLQRLQIKARLCFGHDAGTALRGLQELQELLLWDTRWQSVQFLLRLAADASQADAWPEMRHAMHRLLRRLYYCVTCGGFAVEAALRGRRVLCTLAWVGIAALALPVSTAATTAAMPVHELQAARLCAAALRTARRQPFVVRPCWLPQGLRLLQLHDATLRCHRHCSGCSCLPLQTGNPPGQATQQLRVVQLQIQDGVSGIRYCQHNCESRGASSGSGSSGASLLAAVRQEIRSGRREGLYPTIWGVVGRLLLGPVVPFAVTVAARAGILWLLKGKPQQQHLLRWTHAGRGRARHQGLTREQFRAVLAALGWGV